MPCNCVYTFLCSCVTTNTSTDHIKFATAGFKLLAAERSTAAAVIIAATASATNTDVFVTAVGTVCKPDPAQKLTTHSIPLRSPHNPFKYCVLCSVIRYVLVGVSAISMQARAPLEVAADLGPPHAMPCFVSAASSVFFSLSSFVVTAAGEAASSALRVHTAQYNRLYLCTCRRAVFM